MTDPYDQTEREPRYTICPDCGEDLKWHECGASPSELTLRIRELNDAARKRLANGTITTVAGNFGQRARHHARRRSARAGTSSHVLLSPCGTSQTSRRRTTRMASTTSAPSSSTACKLNWKIDCYDRALEYGSPDPGDAEKTRRVLTILLAEEY